MDTTQEIPTKDICDLEAEKLWKLDDVRAVIAKRISVPVQRLSAFYIVQGDDGGMEVFFEDYGEATRQYRKYRAGYRDARLMVVVCDDHLQADIYVNTIRSWYKRNEDRLAQGRRWLRRWMTPAAKAWELDHVCEAVAREYVIPLSGLTANYSVWEWAPMHYHAKDYADATSHYREIRNADHDGGLFVQVWLKTDTTNPIHEHAVRYWDKEQEKRYQRLKAMPKLEVKPIVNLIKRKPKVAGVAGFQMEDMISAGRDIGLRLNNAQAYEILGDLEENFDAEQGVNWTVIRETIDGHRWDGERPWRWAYQDEVWLTGVVTESEWDERAREIWTFRNGMGVRWIDMCLTLESGAVVTLKVSIPAETPESLVEAVALAKAPKTLATGSDPASNLAIRSARVRLFRPEIDQEEPPDELNAEIEIMVDEREFAAILAGLRLLQIHKEGNVVGWQEWKDILAIADNNYELKPLEIQEIEELAERINTAQ